MDTTDNLELPFILPSQAQKHVTHNEALRRLDAVVQVSCASRRVAVPPSSPQAGQRFVVPANASGAWSGRAGQIAAYQDGAWSFIAARRGWLVWFEDERLLAVADGSGFVEAVTPQRATPVFGVNAIADTGNRLSVSAPASLFNHEGAGHQMKINKRAASDTASLLFQTGFSGRAEFGLAGDDSLRFKVSGDGASWREALAIGQAGHSVFSGAVRLASFTVANLPPAASVGGGAVVFVTNETGGPVPAFSDGTNWRRLTDRAVVA